MKTRDSTQFLIVPNGKLEGGIPLSPALLRKTDTGKWTYDTLACVEGEPWNYEAVYTGEDEYDTVELAFAALMDENHG